MQQDAGNLSLCLRVSLAQRLIMVFCLTRVRPDKARIIASIRRHQPQANVLEGLHLLSIYQQDHGAKWRREPEKACNLVTRRGCQTSSAAETHANAPRGRRTHPSPFLRKSTRPGPPSLDSSRAAMPRVCSSASSGAVLFGTPTQSRRSVYRLANQGTIGARTAMTPGAPALHPVQPAESSQGTIKEMRSHRGGLQHRVRRHAASTASSASSRASSSDSVAPPAGLGQKCRPRASPRRLPPSCPTPRAAIRERLRFEPIVAARKLCIDAREPLLYLQWLALPRSRIQRPGPRRTK